jgi:hypothetical protein
MNQTLLASITEARGRNSTENWTLLPPKRQILFANRAYGYAHDHETPDTWRGQHIEYTYEYCAAS